MEEKPIWIKILPGFISDWLCISKTKEADKLNYAVTASYTIKELEAGIEYDRKIVKLAFASFVLWAVLMIVYAIYKSNWYVFLNIEIYPVPLWGVLSGAFSEVERLEKKKQLNGLLKKYNTESEKISAAEIKSTAWEEFKNLNQ